LSTATFTYKEDVMGTTVIGIDPHKRSHTAVVLDEDEEIAAQLRVAADRRQIERLLAWASDWPERIWAVENVNGLGRLLSQQLVLGRRAGRGCARVALAPHPPALGQVGPQDR
jgi:hypothetical protein